MWWLIELVIEKVISAGQLAILLFLMMLVMLYFFQEKMLYNPDLPTKETKFPECNPRTFRDPGERNMPYENVYIQTEDGCRLHGWFVK